MWLDRKEEENHGGRGSHCPRMYTAKLVLHELASLAIGKHQEKLFDSFSLGILPRLGQFVLHYRKSSSDVHE